MATETNPEMTEMIELVDEKLMQFLQTYPIAQGSKNKMK
jgi:hypothetical protein